MRYGHTVTRQSLAGHVEDQPLPYPVEVRWFPTLMGAEAFAEALKADHPMDVVRVRPCMGWSLRITDPEVPRYAKPGYLTYSDRVKAEAVREAMLRTTPRLKIEILPFVTPEPRPPRRVERP